MEIQRLSRRHRDFPQSLRHIHDPPREIYWLGNLGALGAPSLAVVGTRKPTAYGRQVTDKLAGEAASRGITIISGLALGIDALAHQAALEAGGITVAVLGSSLDQITPATNQWLARKILEQGGALISEYPPGQPVNKLNFVARNRLVAGLSDGVLITEAAAKSGSRHTVTFALDQGKPVLAVPGNITSAMSAGTNHWLSTGGIPATSIKDILLALGMKDSKTKRTLPPASTPEEAAILRLVGKGISEGRQLVEQSGLPAAVFNQTLTMLEITGKIRPYGNDHWGI